MRLHLRRTTAQRIGSRAAARRFGLAALLVLLAVGAAAPAHAGTLPTGFQDAAVFSGLDSPTAVRFASDGRVFVAQKNGIIKVFSSLTATTGTTFADLRSQVDDYWDRGLLGLALDPQFPTRPYVYVLYAYDAPLGATAPVWNDACSDPTGNGCVISGRLSRLTASGNVVRRRAAAHQRLVPAVPEPFHRLAGLRRRTATSTPAEATAQASTGPTGASTSATSAPTLTGQANVCGDPANEGGALRTQDLRTSFRSGRAQRRDPAAGPRHRSGRARQSVRGQRRRQQGAHHRGGPAQPVPLHVPARDERAVDRRRRLGHAGRRSTASPRPTTFTNFGWPCYEGNGQQSGYQSLALCQSLYAAGTGAVAAPVLHVQPRRPGRLRGDAARPPTARRSPASPSRRRRRRIRRRTTPRCSSPTTAATASGPCCRAPNGLPDPANRRTFEAAAANPVDLQIGPDGNLYYADLDGGTIRRITWSVNRSPVAQGDGDRRRAAPRR